MICGSWWSQELKGHQWSYTISGATCSRINANSLTEPSWRREAWGRVREGLPKQCKFLSCLYYKCLRHSERGKDVCVTSWKLSSVQFSSVPQSCPTLCDPLECSMQGFPVHHQLPELTQTHVHQVSDATQPSHPLSSPSPPTSIFPSIRVFSNELVLRSRWPKYWSFSFSFSPSNEYSGLIPFRIDSLNLLAVQGILKSLLQHHSSKALILWHSAFFIVQLSQPYMTTGKTIAFTRWTFVDNASAF